MGKVFLNTEKAIGKTIKGKKSIIFATENKYFCPSKNTIKLRNKIERKKYLPQVCNDLTK